MLTRRRLSHPGGDIVSRENMKSPHILLASSNCRKLRRNLEHLLDQQALAMIDREIAANVAGLFRLGESHYRFAKSIPKGEWRQQVSRYYYAAYHFSRCLRFFKDGTYSTDASDHKVIESLPQDFPTRQTYQNKLGMLRDDRNLADYDHGAVEADLIIPRSDVEAMLDKLYGETKDYLTSGGVTV
jgi:uncharacterized protein (UPF0332 family)